MKSKISVFWIIALAIIIGFSFIACDDKGDDEVKPEPENIASGMSTLNLSGRVYMEDLDEENLNLSYTNYTGPNLTINDNGLGGSGTVTNGNLSYSVGKPNNLATFSREDLEYFFEDYGINTSKESIDGFLLGALEINENEGYIYKGSSAIKINFINASFTLTFELINYLYVDEDVTVTGTGWTDGPYTEEYGGMIFSETYIANNFNLPLKKGWNALHMKMEIAMSPTGPAFDPTGMAYTYTESITLSNPDLRFILGGWIPPITIPPANNTPLTLNTWANGNITSSAGQQFFSFTATASEHYIHFKPGSLDDVNVEVYNSSGVKEGDKVNLWSGKINHSWDVTSGQTYYVRVVPFFQGDSGNYQIAFNSSYSNPDETITFPPVNHTPLTFNTWANGNIAGFASDEFFSFTATASEHYIHFNPGSLDDIDVEVYNSSGAKIGSTSNLWLGGSLYHSWDVTNGQTYYIRVTPWYNNDTGNYQIAFNSSSTSPSGAMGLLLPPSLKVKDSDKVLEKTKKTGINIFGLQNRQTMLNRYQFFKK